MFLRPNHRGKDRKDHTYWARVETVRTPHGPRQRTLCYLGESNSSAQARWLKTVEVINEQGDAQQLKLFPSDVAPPWDDPQVARVLLNKVRLERTRQFGACFLGLDLWRRRIESFFERSSDTSPPTCHGCAWRHRWPSIACAQSGSDPSIEQRLYQRSRMVYLMLRHLTRASTGAPARSPSFQTFIP